jgi:hypothetical protein
MFNIADYFKKFAKIEGDSLVQKDAVAKALKEICGIESAKFEVKKGILYVSGSSIMKSAIYTRKASILTMLRTELSQSKIIDIR